MKIGYTEFSFGYAFTENLIRSSAASPKGAPIFPNLVQEASAGYDVRINLPGIPLFFQYKLPDLMRRPSAKEISNYNLTSLAVPFFRMPLMRRDLSRQHQLLIELEQRYPGNVLYASPCLQDIDEFNQAYNLAGVHERCVFFSPADIGALPDDKAHTVAYREDLPVAYLCSEPREIHTRNFGLLREEALSQFEQKRFATLRLASHEVRDTARSLVSSSMRATEGSIKERISSRRTPIAARPELSEEEQQVIDDILVAREMARVDIGVELLIAQRRV